MGIQGIENLHPEPRDVPLEENHDAEDVPSALARDTQDGPGFDDEAELPPSDFEEDV